MVALGVVFYFLLAVMVLGLTLFEEPRAWVRHAWLQVSGRFRRKAQATGQRLTRAGQTSRRRVGRFVGWMDDSLRRYWYVWLAGGVVLVLPSMIIMSLKGPTVLEGYSDRLTSPVPDEQVALLLQGEHLVPPEPLPPDMFTTAEVEMVRPMLATADRRWDRVDPEFQQRLLWIFRMMKERHGYEMVLLEGYRSPERQNMLASMGQHVTNARAFQSYHQFGLAADSAFLRNGKLVISEKDPWAMRGYQLYGETAEAVGLVWGGRWKMMDLGHVEWRKPGVMGR